MSAFRYLCVRNLSAPDWGSSVLGSIAKEPLEMYVQVPTLPLRCPLGTCRSVLMAFRPPVREVGRDIGFTCRGRTYVRRSRDSVRLGRVDLLDALPHLGQAGRDLGTSARASWIGGW